MGILEIHFHDSEFVFRPSMRVGSSHQGANEDVDAEEVEDDLRFPTDENDPGRKAPVVGAVLLLIVVGALIRVWRNRSEA
jgi:hypothetical protein